MREFYVETKFRPDSLVMIAKIEQIMREYVADGYMLTVRQLYYQLVARDIIPNTERSYKNTVRLVNEARLAGLLDWDAIEDRTRGFLKRPSWKSGKEILESCAAQFHMDMRHEQPCRLFCIVEKEALAGVLQRVCSKYDIPLLAARGYPSASVLREFAKAELMSSTQRILILHLGDHDPSGIDMSRDLEERLRLLSRRSAFELIRVALTMDQIEDQGPPPNPAKTTDSRFAEYEALYGYESWELDALQPRFLTRLVEEHVLEVLDEGLWNARQGEINEIRRRIYEVAEQF
jgi:hypothetical protein